MNHFSCFHRPEDGLTRMELLAILAALGLLAAVALPVLAGGRPRSEAVSCANNLRQLGSAALSYSMDNGGTFPDRRTNFWPQRFSLYYERPDLLRCPSDPGALSSPNVPAPADRAPRSYLLNGWTDYYELTLTPTDLQLFRSRLGPPMPEAAIPYPAQTILFGEKAVWSLHFYMDFDQTTGNDLDHVERSRHGAPRSGDGYGGSNHAMVDGSVRMLRWAQAFGPTNLWAVTDLWRTNTFSIPSSR